MNHTVSYDYASGDLLENRNTYFYTKFHGKAFLTAWHRQREQALAEKKAIDTAASDLDSSPTMHMIEVLHQKLSEHHTGHQTIQTLNRLVQRFEVSKRLHSRYNFNWRPVDATDYKKWTRYVRFAEVLNLAYAITLSLPYLNTLLKIMDTLTAAYQQLSESLSSRVQSLALSERMHVDALCLKLERPLVEGNAAIGQDALILAEHMHMRLKGVVLLAAQTSRSQAYIQALVANGLYPEKVILLGEMPSLEQQSTPNNSWHGILLPNLAESIMQTCDRANIEVSRCSSVDVNSEECVSCISDAEPSVIIYSGVGGQIVSEHTLALAPKFLHMHSGWLPQYRGSTTLYYALLKQEMPGVTALFLDRMIDTGPVVAQKHYPIPPFDMDVDRVYDSAIRADLLVEVLRAYISASDFPTLFEQHPEEGETYYVIHPILKHLAILSLKKDHAS